MESGAADSDLPGSFATPLLLVVDRPIVQHVVEFLARAGIKRIDFVLHHFPNRVEQFLGNGTRWGCEFHFHLTQSFSRSYHSMRFLDSTFSDDLIVLGTADGLPGSDLATHITSGSIPDPQAFVMKQSECSDTGAGGLLWTGWAIVHANLLRSLVNAKSALDFESKLLSIALDNGELCEVNRPISTNSAKALLEANCIMLGRRFGGTGMRLEPTAGQTHLSRNARLHPSVKVIPPVFIGDNASVGPDSLLGPNVVIGRDSVVSENCTVQDSVIFPETYVGPSLSVHHAIVDNNRLINVRLGAVVEDVDLLLLRQLTNGAPNVRKRFRGRSLALAMLVVFVPFLFLATLWVVITRGARSIQRISFVSLPAVENPELWAVRSLWVLASANQQNTAAIRHFLFVFVPGLAQVVAGRLDLSGVSPRSQAELLDLPDEWRKLILQSTCGLINESVLRSGADHSSMEVWAAESFYSVQRTYETDLRMLFTYFRMVASELLGLRPISSVQQAKRQTDIL